MNKVLRKIIEIVERHKNSADFLDVLFGECKKEALSGRPIVICCAGGLGIQMIKVLREVDLNVVALCDNDVKKLDHLILIRQYILSRLPTKSTRMQFLS